MRESAIGVRVRLLVRVRGRRWGRAGGQGKNWFHSVGEVWHNFMSDMNFLDLFVRSKHHGTAENDSHKPFQIELSCSVLDCSSQKVQSKMATASRSSLFSL